MSTFLINNNKKSNNLTSTFANASSSNRSYVNNIFVHRNQVANIGSQVINGQDTDPALPSGNFANNNKYPISLYTTSLAGLQNKTIKGNESSINRARYIKTALTTTAIRQGKYNLYTGKFNDTYPKADYYILCPDQLSTSYSMGKKVIGINSSLVSDCNQYDSQIDNPVLSIQFDGNGNLIQNGIILRFKLLSSGNNTVQALNNIPSDFGWNTMFVKNSDTYTETLADGSSVKSIDYSKILPNGEYSIEYDLLTSNDPSSFNASRYSLNIVVSNSTIDRIYQVKFNNPPEVLPGWGGNPNDPYASLNESNTQKLNGLFLGLMEGTYTVPTKTNLLNSKDIGSSVLYTSLITTGVNLNPPIPSFFDSPENFTIEVSIEAIDKQVVFAQLSIASQFQRLGEYGMTNTALIAQINDGVSSMSTTNYSGWIKSTFDAAGGLGGWGKQSCILSPEMTCPTEGDGDKKNLGGIPIGSRAPRLCIECGSKYSSSGGGKKYGKCKHIPC